MATILATGLALSALLPAGAQSLTGTLRAQGTVMISTGGDFVRAVDGQPVTAGMRLMVGDDGSASIEYGPDCKRSYDSAGTYTIAPARCDNDRKQDDKSRQEDAQQQSQAQGNEAGGGGTAAAGNGSLLAELGVIGGAVAAGAAAIQQQGNDTPPDRPVSQ